MEARINFHYFLWKVHHFILWLLLEKLHPYFTERGLNITQSYGKETDLYMCIYYDHSSDQLIAI